jgi:glycosyltransferase involved in cell wall biosynthesis
MDTVGLPTRLAAVEADNALLRTALAEAEARAAGSGHGLLLRDAIGLTEHTLTCRHAAVPGRVTVVIPAFNAARFLERAVRSVWAQTYPAERIEILVADDGSTDRTCALARRLAAKSPSTLRVLRHPGGANRGVAPTRQLAADEATGEFIALLDADDIFLPARLGATVRALSKDAACAAVCSLGRNVDNDGRRVKGHNGTKRAGEWRTLGKGLRPPFTFDQLWRVDPIANSSLTIRRSALERVGGFPTLMAHQAEDWLLVLKLSLLAPIACLDRELMLYTHHSGAYTNAYHSNGWHEGARLEAFYHAAWWMLRTPEHAEAGARFFRREYPKQIADHQRLLPLVREYYHGGGRPAAGGAALADHLQHLGAELESMQRVVRATLSENKRLRRLVSGLQPGVSSDQVPLAPGTRTGSKRRSSSASPSSGCETSGVTMRSAATPRWMSCARIESR